MERIELITSKEYWVETLEIMNSQAHTDYDIATVIAEKMLEAMNYIPCCTELNIAENKPIFDEGYKLGWKEGYQEGNSDI